MCKGRKVWWWLRIKNYRANTVYEKKKKQVVLRQLILNSNHKLTLSDLLDLSNFMLYKLIKLLTLLTIKLFRPFFFNHQAFAFFALFFLYFWVDSDDVSLRNISLFLAKIQIGLVEVVSKLLKIVHSQEILIARWHLILLYPKDSGIIVKLFIHYL